MFWHSSVRCHEEQIRSPNASPLSISSYPACMRQVANSNCLTIPNISAKYALVTQGQLTIDKMHSTLEPDCKVHALAENIDFISGLTLYTA